MAHPAHLLFVLMHVAAISATAAANAENAAPPAQHAPAGAQGVPPKSAEESLGCLVTHPELRVELVAAEPLVSDPVAIDFGPDGRLWVAEMNDYGRGVYERFETTGRVRWLRDTDADGRFDEAETFVDGLRFPTGVKVQPDGVLICDAPDILFAKDDDDDGKADSVQTLYSGFEVRNAQARVNSLRLGLDNWLYGSCGLFGGRITSTLTGAVTDVTGRDFRIDPTSGAIEPVTGRTQQGRCRNDWGDWFGCSNGNLLMHYPVEDRYVRRNPLVAPPPTVVSAATGPNASRLIPAGEIVRFELSGAPGRPTSACGLGIYRDVLLGEAYAGNAFTCEPVHQLVHRLVLEPQGVTFEGRRAANEQDREFLASTDKWFRPVQVRTGPDGGLWIVDMYRYVIEHPRWIPQSTLEDVDVFAGRGLGRIYRLVPQNESRSARPWLRPDRMSAAELVQQLDQPNGTVRDLAQQLLVQRREPQTARLLKQLVRSARLPQGQLHALATLDGLGRLAPGDVLHALQAEHIEVVRRAIRLAEPYLDVDRGLRSAVIRLAARSNPRVLQQVAWSLGECDHADAAAALARLLRSGASDRYVRAAALSSVDSQNAVAILKRYDALAADDEEGDVFSQLASLALRLGAERDVDAIFRMALAGASDPPAQFLYLASLLDAADQRSDDVAARVKSPTVRRIREVYDAAIAATEASDPARRAALRLLARSEGSATRILLGDEGERRERTLRRISGMLSARHPLAIQQDALAAMSRVDDPLAAELLLARWNDVGGQMRDEIIDALLGRDAWTVRALRAIEAGTLATGHFGAARRQQILTHRRHDVREMTERLFADSVSADRAALIDRYRPALEAPADLERGRAVFRKTCAACHRLEDHGHPVGPDLVALTNREPEWLLTTILDPNRDVDARYMGWTAVDRDGRVASGLLAEETSSAIRLNAANGKEHVILRDELDELRCSNRSLMPEGLERDLSPADVANVIRYVSQFKKRTAVATVADAPLPRRPPEIAPFLLDDAQPVQRRQAVIDRRPGMGPAIISRLIRGLGDDADEVYRRIPWIWRVALAVGKRNDGGELRDLLDVSLPRDRQPLRDWQAVVIGGGIVNGLSQRGLWPRERLEEVLAGVPDGVARWRRTLDLAATMADDERVRSGTRYDALRIIALAGWESRGADLLRYLAEGVPDELQMGAVSGLVDIPAEEATTALIERLPLLSARNRRLAVEGLLRTEERSLALLEAIRWGRVSREFFAAETFSDHGSARVRRLAAKVFAD